ncbi:hypothetical protein HAX54_013976 [Datura stramonium]|uniref:Uncharacterized protein n=1 Tax=Datura stramonium TaxID=4076 RepID=A0ABS8TPV2_DATST|nr:hypothetical protein [Datura stramonium]
MILDHWCGIVLWWLEQEGRAAGIMVSGRKEEADLVDLVRGGEVVFMEEMERGMVGGGRKTMREGEDDNVKAMEKGICRELRRFAEGYGERGRRGGKGRGR